MSARDTYPAVAVLADAAAEQGKTALPEAVRMFHEIDELRLNLAWAVAIAEDRGAENERLRSDLAYHLAEIEAIRRRCAADER